MHTLITMLCAVVDAIEGQVEHEVMHLSVFPDVIWADDELLSTVVVGENALERIIEDRSDVALYLALGYGTDHPEYN